MFAASAILRVMVDAVWSRVSGTAVTCARSHVKCRNATYPGSKVDRGIVPDDKVNWDVVFVDYKPNRYTSNSVLNKPVWADPDFEVEKPTDGIWNKFDKVNNVNRISHMGPYQITDGLPRNPVGRTGIVGRGQLGRWGPNHAADPIVTRWKVDENGCRVIHKATNKPVLQFVSIQRTDSGEWALPGGMVDPGELVKTTLKREFMEEAMNSLEATDDDRNDMERKLDEFFQNYTEIYRGYVDDPRNTDNSWMETMAYNFHDKTGEFVGKLQLTAGDDAASVKWMDIDSGLQLYASHSEFIRKVVTIHKCHW